MATTPAPVVPAVPPKIDPAAARAGLFQQQRQQVDENLQNQQQQQSDAIQRRMTAIGQGYGSGASLGLQRQLSNDVMGQRAQALGAINAGEAQANLASQEAQFGRDFQREETQRARDAQESQFGRTMAEQGRMFDVEQGNKRSQLDMAQRQMEMDKEAQWFNERMAELQSGHQVDLDISRGHYSTPQEYDKFLRRFIALQNLRNNLAYGEQPARPARTNNDEQMFLGG